MIVCCFYKESIMNDGITVQIHNGFDGTGSTLFADFLA